MLLVKLYVCSNTSVNLKYDVIVMITSYTKFTKSFLSVLHQVKDLKSFYMSNVVNLIRDHQHDISEQVEVAVRLLKKGQIIALPTDTVYGIAADAQNTAAISKLYEVKNRAIYKPLAICVSDPEEVGKWCHLDSSFPLGLLQVLLPGPVTLVFKRNALLNDSLNPGISCVGIRVPDHPFIRAVARNLSSPLALTSANLSLEKSSLTTMEFSNMWNSLSAVFDGGHLGEGNSRTARLGSTVVDLSVPGCFHIIRPGCALQNTVTILKEFGLFEQ